MHTTRNVIFYQYRRYYNPFSITILWVYLFLRFYVNNSGFIYDQTDSLCVLCMINVQLIERVNKMWGIFMYVNLLGCSEWGSHPGHPVWFKSCEFPALVRVQRASDWPWWRSSARQPPGSTVGSRIQRGALPRDCRRRPSWS